MEKIQELLELLRTATPMLQEFVEWKQQEAAKEKEYIQEQTQSQEEFAKWVKQRQEEQAQQEADTAELQKHFYGADEWEKERYSPSFF